MAELSNQFWGKGIDAAFGGSPKVPAPFESMAKHKKLRDYDPELVQRAISSPPDLQDVDPRTVRATQPWVTREGVEHYLSPEYRQTGRTFADAHDPGNTYPIVYQRRAEGMPDRDFLLSGHHRATAALVSGEQFKAMVVKGGFGPPRSGTV